MLLRYHSLADKYDFFVKISLYKSVHTPQHDIEFEIFTSRLNSIWVGTELAISWTPLSFSHNTTSFYTDENGFEPVERVINSSKPVEQQFYPVTSYLVLYDKKRDLVFSVQNSVSEAASAYKGGRVEFIVNRRNF
mmetsp:Transcript_659/g.369  ORF Transcript_659/g.369 Transcript_659/m.369 type:complete len:135 (+) Transcript_659:585-989(+)